MITKKNDYQKGFANKIDNFNHCVNICCVLTICQLICAVFYMDCFIFFCSLPYVVGTL